MRLSYLKTPKLKHEIIHKQITKNEPQPDNNDLKQSSYIFFFNQLTKHTGH